MGQDEKGNAMSQISPSYVTGLEKYINELRNQVSSLKAELREINTAIDGPACDLTHTAAECIKKLKEENESLRKDAERWAAMSALMFLGDIECTQDDGYTICVEPVENIVGKCWNGDTPEEAIDDAMAQGEK